jgi:MOSC domain-containing protein YiiM
MPPQLVSINVGRPRAVPRGKGTVETAIWKHPVDGPVAARGVNLEGDDQADRTVHGALAARLLAAPQPAEDWREWAQAHAAAA